MAWLQRVRRALTTAPSGRDLRELAVAGLGLSGVLLALGLSTGLFVFEPASAVEIGRTALIALIFPALGEEIVFRAALVPSRDENARPWPAYVVSTLLFVVWHPIEGFTILADHRDLFLRPDFLTCAALLGATCAVLRYRSNSIWPAVVLHWSFVVGWKACLGGPSLAI